LASGEGSIIPGMSNKNAQRAAALLETGLQRLQEGQIVQARLLCEQALKLAPRQPDALHLLGVIALQSGEHAAAIEPLQQAVAMRPDQSDYQANVAYAYVGLKRYAEALAAFERAARLDPADPELQLGLGSCYGMLGEAAKAEAVFRRLVARHPGYPLGWLNLANALRDQERYEEAREQYVRVTQLAPQLAEAQCNLGIALHKLGRFEEAEQSFQACFARHPDFTPAYVSRAITLNSLRRHEEAEASCRQALAREPGQKNAWPVLGKALAGQRRWGEALQCFERAVKEYPESSDALGDLGDALAHAGRVGEALAALDRACAMENVPSFARFFRATTLFSVGRMAEGAVEYLGRHERSTFSERHPDRSLAWELPRDLQGREVCLLGEQGIGDELFFLRYAPQLRARGGRIRYYGNPKIAGILARSPELLESANPNTGAYAPADHTIMVGDLPYLLSQLEASPYRMRSAGAAMAMPIPWNCRVYWPELPPPLALKPLPERVATVSGRLGRLGPPPYMGLTWRAGTGPQEQRGHVWFLFKEIPLERFATALRGFEGTFLSLQRRPQAGETERVATLLGRTVHDLSAANEDLEEMLALLAVLDDYVGVSNTNMHLRAATGRTAKVLVPWPAEWRWMAVGDESPWFPGFTVYRQKLNGDWSPGLEHLAHDLQRGFGRGKYPPQ
jgi:tetratricopeptide (TPR) repeat protein